MGGMSEPIWVIRKHLECRFAGQFGVALCVERQHFFLPSKNQQLSPADEFSPFLLTILSSKDKFI